MTGAGEGPRHHRSRIAGIAGRLAAALCFLLATSAQAEPRVLGWLEPITVGDAGTRLVAKLDTGAKTSSLDATDIQPFEKNGAAWVRFGIRPQKKGAPVRIEARIIGERKIRSAVGHDERLVVELPTCIAGTKQRTQFTLSERGGMNYRVILGRRALEGAFAVDSARTLTTEPNCSGP